MSILPNEEITSSPSGATEAPPRAPSIEAIRQVGNEVANKHAGTGGAEQKKRGRPSNAEKARRMGSSQNVDTPVGSPSQPAPLVDPEAIKAWKEGIGSLCKVGDGFLVRRLYKGSYDITHDKAISQGIAEDAGMTELECEHISLFSARIIAKYGLLNKYADEALLLAAVFGYFARMTWAFKRLEDISAEIMKNKNKNATGSQVIQTPNNGAIRNG